MPNRNDSSSPLSRLINDDNLTILENVIPYCNTNLGKLLALCLKFSEMQKIIEGFDDSERLNACGFENNSTDIESILRSVRGSVSKYNQILSEHPELVRPPAPAAAETQNAPEANPFSDPSLFFLLNSLMNNSDGNQNEKLKQVMALAQNSDNKDMEKILSTLLNSGLRSKGDALSK